MERDELLDRRAACAFFGGVRPIHFATLYRGIDAGRYPKPVRVSPNTSRWLRSECEIALRALISARDDGREVEG
jgi:predicted DNA-binding transcriptional regulator AlpA